MGEQLKANTDTTTHKLVYNCKYVHAHVLCTMGSTSLLWYDSMHPLGQLKVS